MSFLEQLQAKINNLDERTWYHYVAVAAGLIFSINRAYFIFLFE